MANNTDDFFSFALSDHGAGDAARRPDESAPPPAGTAQPPASVTPAAPPLFELGPVLRVDAHQAAEAPPADRVEPGRLSDRVPQRVAAGIGAAVVVVALVGFLSRSSDTGGDGAARRYNSAPRAAAQVVATSKGEVRVPGRARIAAAQDVVLDLDATAEMRRVVCKVEAGEIVVLTHLEQDPQGARVRISSSAVGCAGWLRASDLSPE